ncbi:MAG: reverse transcriptase domain-containing protein [Thermoplasmata archaeon]
MKDKVSELQRMLYDMAKADPNRRFHSLYDKIWRIDVLNAAWKQVKQNGGTYGVDHITIQDIKKNEEAELAEIQTELRTKTFKPSPLRRAYIPKSNGKMRGLGIPTIKDRIVQTAIKIVIEPIFESGFEPNSYGFRPDKSAHDAVDNIAKYLNFGCENVIDADITGCFDNIPKHELMEQISKRISVLRE